MCLGVKVFKGLSSRDKRYVKSKIIPLKTYQQKYRLVSELLLKCLQEYRQGGLGWWYIDLQLRNTISHGFLQLVGKN